MPGMSRIRGILPRESTGISVVPDLFYPGTAPRVWSGILMGELLPGQDRDPSAELSREILRAVISKLTWGKYLS